MDKEIIDKQSLGKLTIEEEFIVDIINKQFDNFSARDNSGLAPIKHYFTFTAGGYTLCSQFNSEFKINEKTYQIKNTKLMKELRKLKNVLFKKDMNNIKNIFKSYDSKNN